ncbi:MAG TPA: hypothetical protein PK280_02700 [Planctomycetota bacterium]|nr:hypothetical protein [Planctomycetota bacterium]
MIGRTKSWMLWLAGFLCALVFGRNVSAGEATEKHGVRPRPPLAEPEKPAAGIEDSKEWQALLAAWKEAEEVASGRRGQYPFDRKGQEKLLADLDQAARDLDKLAADGCLSEAEAGLLKDEKQVLVARVARFRPKELEGATCYKPMELPAPAQASSERLARRLALLEKLVAGGKVHRAAMEKVLASVQADLAVLDDDRQLAPLGAQERAAAERTRDAARAAVEKLGKLLRDGK